jgi:hypothetical protein
LAERGEDAGECERENEGGFAHGDFLFARGKLRFRRERKVYTEGNKAGWWGDWLSPAIVDPAQRWFVVSDAFAREKANFRGNCKLLIVLKRAPCRDFAPSLRDCESSIDAYPGLRCACPGLISILPPGEKRRGFIFPEHRRFHLPAIRRGRGTTDTICENALDVEVLDVEGVVFDEFAAGFYVFAHQGGEDGFTFGDVF